MTLLPESAIKKDNETIKTSNRTTQASEGVPQESQVTSNHQSSKGCGIGEQDTSQKTFVNLDTLGLRRSNRIAKNPFKGRYAMAMVIFSAMTTQCSQTTTLGFSVLAKCYQAK